MHKWLSIHESLPYQLQKHCIQYKKWKKYTKSPPKNIIKSLEHECKLVDRIFHKIYHDYNHPIFFCRVTYTREDIQKFVELNKTCIYKICKRLDKKIQSNTKKWLLDVKQNLRFKFLGGTEITSLNIKFPTECPICFESVNRIIIARCGHYLCFDCMENLYHLHGQNGKVYNLIYNADYNNTVNCPFCRISYPFMRCKICQRVTNKN
jgi:hypothetical protein